jgi:hypothetical protein
MQRKWHRRYGFGALPLVALAVLAGTFASAHRIRASDLGVIEGRVTNRDGSPVASANLVVVEARRGAIADETGFFRILGVPAGRWQMRVQALGYPSLADTVVITGGDTLRRDYRMTWSDPYRTVILRDSLIDAGRWPPRLDPYLEARMRGAREVRIFRLDPAGFRHPPPADTARFVGGWPIVGEVRRPRPLVDALLPALGDTLLYIDKALGAIKPCGGLRPGIDVRFVGAGPPTDLLLCFQCGEFAIWGRDGRTQAGDFGPHAAEFVRFAKGAFPTDPAIQALGRPRADD